MGSHYSRTEWFLYAEDKIQDGRKTAMEEHLGSCDACLESYLSVVLMGDQKQAAALITRNFKDKVMKHLKEERKFGQPKGRQLSQPEKGLRTQPRVNAAGQRHAHLLQYYAVAAAITLLLMSGGLFDLLGKGLPQAVNKEKSLVSHMEQGLSFGWSQRLVDKIALGIDLITGEQEGVENAQE